MKFRILIITLLIPLSINFIYPVTGSEALLKALEENELTDFLINEYKRKLFFGEVRQDEKGMVWLKLALSYRKLNNESNMTKAFTRALQNSSDKNFRDVIYSEIALFYLSRGKTDLADIFITKLAGNRAKLLGQSLKNISNLFAGKNKKLVNSLKQQKIKPHLLSDIQLRLEKIGRIKKKSKALINLRFFFPGIISFLNLDFYGGAKTLLFNYIYLEPLLFKSTLLEKIISVIAFYRYNRNDIVRKSQILSEKNREQILVIEQEIFEIIIDKNSFSDNQVQDLPFYVNNPSYGVICQMFFYTIFCKGYL